MDAGKRWTAYSAFGQLPCEMGNGVQNCFRINRLLSFGQCNRSGASGNIESGTTAVIVFITEPKPVFGSIIKSDKNGIVCIRVNTGETIGRISRQRIDLNGTVIGTEALANRVGF